MHFFNNNRTILIINPKAGTKRLAFLRRELCKYHNELDYTTFDDINEFKSFIRKNFENYDIFVAVGGDGTVNSLAAELIETGKLMGVLPVGSGNGFAREMGFRKNIRSLVESIRKKDPIDIDVLYVNHLPCFNMAGIGLDSYVAHKFHGLEKRGFWNYALTSIRIASGLKPFRATISISGKEVEEDLIMVSVANTRQFGNNAIIVPAAMPNDGIFNLALVKPIPWILFPYFAVRMLTGTLTECRYLRYLTNDNHAVISSPEKRYHVDGEPVIINDPVNITIRKNSLKVLRTNHTRWN